MEFNDQLTEHQLERLSESRDLERSCQRFYDKIITSNATEGRLASIARTNLQTGFLWLNVALTRKPKD